MGRRLLTALILAGLAAAAWWIVRAEPESTTGLVVVVEVADRRGAPVKAAQIERVFENKRLRVDGAGRARLAGVILRELDEPSPETIARAIKVHAPFHALRADDAPVIEQRADGTWSMRLALTQHGVLRLYVDQTHLGPCKAFPAAAEGGHPAWEAIGGRQVARQGAPASYRIYDASQPIEVRLEGEPDDEGTIGVATRRRLVEAPAAGHVVEEVLKPDEVQVILGQVVLGDGPKPPSLGGRARVTEITDDGGRIPLAIVRVQKDGRFIARRTGKGRYELEFDLDFFPGTTTLTVLGGAGFEVTPSQPAVWLTLAHPEVDLTKRSVLVRTYASGDEVEPGAQLAPGDGSSYVALPRPGSYRLALVVGGSDAYPPLDATVAFDVVAGAAQATATFSERRHGTLIVRFGEGAFGQARGATVHLLGHPFERTATAIPGLAESVTFKHVAATEATEVLVEWDDEAGRASRREQVMVKAGEVTTLVIEERRP